MNMRAQLGVDLGVELRGQMVTPYLTFWGTARPFSKSLEMLKSEQNSSCLRPHTLGPYFPLRPSIFISVAMSS